MPPNTTPEPRSSAQLAGATLLAIAVSAVVLVTVVLPAEYGLDPLGTGRALGIYRAPAVVDAPSLAGEAVAPGGAAGVRTHPEAFRTDEMSVTLQPGEGSEIKAAMTRGETLVFTWSSTGPVDVDMHGDAADPAEGEYFGYGKGELQSGASGVFEAPVTGNHGWFWQNLNEVPVTVTVTTSGFYRRLFRP